MVEVFETRTEFCPVSAYQKWRKVSKVAFSSTKPAKKAFNTDLKSKVKPIIQP
jgi:hypothetical protein